MEPGAKPVGAGQGQQPPQPLGDLVCLAMSHELKNDLHALFGLLTLIRDAPAFPTAARQQAGRGLKLAESMARRVRAVAGVLLEETGATLSDDRERLQAVVNRSVEAVNLRGGWAGGRGTVEVRGDAGTVMVERPFLLEIALTNLVTNAVFAAPRDAEPPVVDVAAAAGAWEVTVRDRGGGIPEGARRVLLGQEGALAEVDLTRPSGRWGFGLILVRAAALAAAWEVDIATGTGDRPGSAVRLRGKAAAAGGDGGPRPGPRSGGARSGVNRLEHEGEHRVG